MHERLAPLSACTPPLRGVAWLCLLLATVTALACTGNTVSILTARAVRSGEAADGPRIAVAINPAAAGMQVQARTGKTATDVTFYEIELIKDQGAAAGTDYTNATMATGGRIVGSVYLDGPSATVVAGTLADGGNPREFAFTNVSPGTYRVRVRAKSDATTPGSTVISEADTYFSLAGGWEISENTATVTDGSSVVTYTAPDTAKLTVDVNLVDGVGDNVATTVTVGNGRSAAASRLAPDDAGSPTAVHSYIVNRDGVNSEFVWIPPFTAYQLVLASACGTTLRFGEQDQNRPNGYWVSSPPNAGTAGVHYVGMTLGGFYVAKYEASRANATNSSDGSSTVAAVRPQVVPWTSITWDAAAQACQEFHPNAHLMTDEEWTALAVWGMINNITPKGNNSYGIDVSSSPTFTDDPTHAGTARALTGSASSDTDVAHDGTAGGVMDLNGNVAEWTGSLSLRNLLGNWYLDDVEDGTAYGAVANNRVVGLRASPVLGRAGVPLQGSTPHADFGNDSVTVPAVLADGKAVRGGNWTTGDQAGVWCIDMTNGRTTSSPMIGFRPALRF